MSGPKLIELRRMRAALERQRDHDRCAAFGSEYARLCAEWQAWEKRLVQVGVPVPAEERVSLPEHVRARVATLLRAGAHHEAARIFGEEVAGLRALVVKRRGQFQERIANLQQRYRQWLQNCEILAEERAQFLAHWTAAIPAGWPENERERILALVHQALPGVAAAAVTVFPDNPAAIALFEKEAAVSDAALAALRAAGPQLASELNSTHARLLAASLSRTVTTSPSLTETLQRLGPAPRPRPAAQDQAVLELDKVLAELAAFASEPFFADASRKAEEIQAEPDPMRRRMLSEGLILDAGAHLRQIRRLDQWREEVRKLIDSAAHLEDPAVQTVVSELRLNLDSDCVIDLEPLRQRLRAAIELAEATREREEKRRALVDSLKELGYETNEGLETALVKQGRLVLRRPGDVEYAVELVVNPELNQVQTALVRYADSDVLTEQQRRRDREREESWCQDHARLREKMSARGVESRFKLQLKPGEQPVRVVVDKTRSAASRHRPAGERNRS